MKKRLIESRTSHSLSLLLRDAHWFSPLCIVIVLPLRSTYFYNCDQGRVLTIKNKNIVPSFPSKNHNILVGNNYKSKNFWNHPISLIYLDSAYSIAYIENKKLKFLPF